MQGELARSATKYENNRRSTEVARDVSNISSVDTIDRAFYLLKALDSFAEYSEKISYYEITRQNDGGNLRKIGNLQKSAKDCLHKGRIAFLSANNLDPYANNNIKRQQLIVKTVIMADEFKEAYTGPGTDDRRQTLRRQLFSEIELLNSLESN